LSRREALDSIASEIVVCPKCRLSKSRKKAVPGEGSDTGTVMFVGEGPGRNEDLQGRPFVGQAGRLLDELLTMAGLIRSDVFICNVVRCRPPNNRDPLPDEIETCTPYLERQINVIRPKLIVTLGRHSTEYFFLKTSLPFKGITRATGKARDVTFLSLSLTVFPTLHPAAGIYSAEYKRLLIRDFRRLKEILEGRE
jgi:DNA polymerase